MWQLQSHTIYAFVWFSAKMYLSKGGYASSHTLYVSHGGYNSVSAHHPHVSIVRPTAYASLSVDPSDPALIAAAEQYRSAHFECGGWH
jgi:hypothetical protein